MFEQKFDKMITMIRAGLIEKHGNDFLKLSKHSQAALMSDAMLKYMLEQKERQA